MSRRKIKKRRRLAKIGEYRTVVPKKGVYIHVRKTKRGITKGRFLRRTKRRAKLTGKPTKQKLRRKGVI